MNMFRVDVPIFLLAVVVCHSCTKEEAESAFYDYEGHRAKVQFSHKSTTMGSVVDWGGDIYMWVKDPKDHFSHVSHEIVHVIDLLCELKGMAKDEELRAYLTGWFKINLADQISVDIKEKTKKKKGKKCRKKEKKK